MKELKTLEYIKARLSIPEDLLNDDFFETKYYGHDLTPTCETKIVGTPIYCQQVKEEIVHIIQFFELDFIPYSIGDAGIIRINDKCEVYYDCF